MRRYTLLDVLIATALVAMNVAALRAEGHDGESVWALIVYLSPTAMTCLIHLRMRLTIAVAGATHYATTAVWTFLHAAAANMALNASNASNTNARQVLVFSNAWNDTAEMLGWGIVLAATYSVICYTAVAASSDVDAAIDTRT